MRLNAEKHDTSGKLLCYKKACSRSYYVCNPLENNIELKDANGTSYGLIAVLCEKSISIVFDSTQNMKVAPHEY